MSKYLVTLTPTGRFFFGGDMTFTVGDAEKDKEKVLKAKSEGVRDEEAETRVVYNEAFASYIIRSSKFPQQTSLLGMLRFLILSHHEDVFDTETQKIKDPAKATELIGEHGFRVNSDHDAKNKFEKIRSVGTCFLRNAETAYWPAPLDYNLTIEGFESISGATLNKKALSIPIIKKGENEYTSKDKLYEGYISSSGAVLEGNKIFEEDIRIGIRKNINGKTEDNAFYKQIGYRLKEGFQFAFTVEADEDLTQYGKQTVSVGADSSTFIFEAFENGTEPKWPASYKRSGDGWQKVVLLADSYLDSSDLEGADLKKPDFGYVKYAITTMKPFRFIKSTVNDESYNLVGNLHKRSERYNLYSAGSVFFVEKGNAEEFKKRIKAKAEFVQIGYNNCE